MKKLGIIIALLVVISTGCVYNCEANRKPHCSDPWPSAPGPGPYPCSVKYERWYYNGPNDQCEKVEFWSCNGYGGYGFGSKDDCEKCQCH